MPLYKTQAVVLRGIKLSEKDKLVTFLTRDYGKIKCVAKGARRIKSRHLFDEWIGFELPSQAGQDQAMRYIFNFRFRFLGNFQSLRMVYIESQ